MNTRASSQNFAGAVLSAEETRQVSGGGYDFENSVPAKPGQVEVAIYVDGVFMGTGHVNRDDWEMHQAGAEWCQLGPFNPFGAGPHTH
jgi:hypothetical protein